MPVSATIAVNSESTLLRSTFTNVRWKRHPLYLFDEAAMSFHDPFRVGLSTEIADKTRIIWFRGENMVDPASFYSAVRDAVPRASYMGSNLDALSDVMRGEAVYPHVAGPKYLLWTRADVLFRENPEFFWKVFHTVVYDAKWSSEGLKRPLQGGRQPVALVMTGTWEAMSTEALRNLSELFILPELYNSYFESRSTSVCAYRVTLAAQTASLSVNGSGP